MAAITTGKDTTAITNRKHRKSVVNIDDPDSQPLLPVKENKPSVYDPPDITSESLRERWALQEIGLSTHNTFKSLYTLPLRALIAAFRVIDSALSYLRYPLLGLVILSFMYGHLSDVYPHEHDGGIDTNPSTIMVTTTVTKISTTTVLPSSSTSRGISTLENLEGGTAGISTIRKKNPIKPSTSSPSDFLSFVIKTDLACDGSSWLSSKEATKKAAQTSSPGNSTTTSFRRSRKAAATDMEKPITSARESISARAPPSSDPRRSTTQKKRMYL
ncbi:hypothetical protein ONS95_004337 [Cadophora gregata]|uniref:uncharacterized protein n=1 Tax=Cadophora gregata TaxID=51156 RepID=UPI0026DB1A71|nr:uncharacterized protein ONS95_004337 [Cadophora gregata]KAK0105278.1 hypothetical protein ONS96_004674 [Cadophora gregata f. sp. sojae]KAK0105822.1 hypothetical protein ONS95_004337 [Cadophora gregata]